MADETISETGEYKVHLDAYSGPLDLLLFLIRRDEVDVYDIPIAEVARQYLEYVHVLREIDPEAVSEFLVVAATLMEIKSRMLLPTPPPEESIAEAVDPRQDLVRQLLEYKRFKDAAHRLEASAEQRAAKFARSPALLGLPPEEMELDHVDVWDLFHAFKRLLEQVGKSGPVHRVSVDDTPLALHADDILDFIDGAGGVQKFEEIFSGRTKAEMIGLFLALLELIRQKRVRVSQDRPFGTILVHLLCREPIDPSVMESGWETEPDELSEAEVRARVATPVSAPTAEVLGHDERGLAIDGYPTESTWGPEVNPTSQCPEKAVEESRPMEEDQSQKV